MSKNELEIWVVYYDPLDFPGLYVARKWLTDVPTKERYIGDTLEQVRQCIPEGKILLMRDPSDDPKIVEIWI